MPSEHRWVAGKTIEQTDGPRKNRGVNILIKGNQTATQILANSDNNSEK
jgi:hypothetical protein